VLGVEPDVVGAAVAAPVAAGEGCAAVVGVLAAAGGLVGAVVGVGCAPHAPSITAIMTSAAKTINRFEPLKYMLTPPEVYFASTSDTPLRQPSDARDTLYAFIHDISSTIALHLPEVMS
jgi:hypothetical protein